MSPILSSSILTLGSQSCVTVRPTTDCTVAGKLGAGMDCGNSISGQKTQLTLEQTVAFLEPAQATPKTPARGGANANIAPFLHYYSAGSAFDIKMICIDQ